MKFVSVFTGIGGLDLGLEQAGWECVYQIENDPDCLHLLWNHFPKVPKSEDVREVKVSDLPKCDALVGGFPCQDLSYAGYGKGLEGERSKLYWDYFNLLCLLRPRYAVIENVSALLNRGGGAVLSSLASLGYDAEWQTLQASDFGLPHRRKRLFIVAYSHSLVRSKCERLGAEQDREAEVFRGSGTECTSVRVSSADTSFGMDDGFSRELYQRGVPGIGNAVAVPVGRFVGEMINQHWQRLGGKQ